MRYLDLTLPTPEENLALDEALLDEAELSEGPTETLRFWEAGGEMVVVGRSSVVDDEVRVEACRRAGVPILRRASGGAAVLAGPGCLMYAAVLDCRRRPELPGSIAPIVSSSAYSPERSGGSCRTSPVRGPATWRLPGGSFRATACGAGAGACFTTERSCTASRWAGSANA